MDVVAGNVLIKLQLADVQRFDDGLVVQQEEPRVAANLVGQRIQIDFIFLRVFVVVVVALGGIVLGENTVGLEEFIQRVGRREALLGGGGTGAVDATFVFNRNLRLEQRAQLLADDLLRLLIMAEFW